MSSQDPTEIITKSGLLGIAILLITTGLAQIERGGQMVGLALCGMGIACIVIREIIKPYVNPPQPTPTPAK